MLACSRARVEDVVMPDSQSLILFLAALVAGVVCFRLFMVLGRRTGHEPTPPTPQERAAMERAQKEKAEKARAQPVLTAAAAGGPSGLVAIQLADRHFDISHFMAGAREAYSRVTKAFAAGNSAALAPLVSSQVLEAFNSAIATREGSVPTFTNLDDAHIQSATLEGKHAEITLIFRALFTGADGAHEVRDAWTFARDLSSKNPNWTLVATQPASADGDVAG
jgi:predicted lipid-binding transport protein (Tim44 family)